MRNLPYILLAIGVIIALILLAAGGISYGVAILGFIVVVVFGVLHVEIIRLKGANGGHVTLRLQCACSYCVICCCRERHSEIRPRLSLEYK